MPTSSLESGPDEPVFVPPTVAYRTVVLESFAAGVVVLALTLILSPGDAGARRPGPHLAWIAVLLLAARYGTKGLCVSLPICAALLAAAAGVLGNIRALGERLDRGADLSALVAAVLVAWIASTHEGRFRELAGKLDAAKSRSFDDRKAGRTMQEALVALRTRADRMNLSLTFLRNVAERVERGDPEQAASAALALAMTCLDARAGVVKLVAPDRRPTLPTGIAILPSILSWAGPWNGEGSAPTLEDDHVVAVALETGRPTQATAVDGAALGDAEMAVPLLDWSGKAFGVLAVRGLPYRAAGMTALRDLAVASDWLATALTDTRRQDAAGTRRSPEHHRDGHPLLEPPSFSTDPDLQSPLPPEVQA